MMIRIRLPKGFYECFGLLVGPFSLYGLFFVANYHELSKWIFALWLLSSLFVIHGGLRWIFDTTGRNMAQNFVEENRGYGYWQNVYLTPLERDIHSRRPFAALYAMLYMLALLISFFLSLGTTYWK